MKKYCKNCKYFSKRGFLWVSDCRKTLYLKWFDDITGLKEKRKHKIGREVWKYNNKNNCPYYNPK